jgi:hypothetical protein
VRLEVEVSSAKAGDEIELFIRRGRNQVQIEVNPLSRGPVPLEGRRSLNPEAHRVFTTEMVAPVLATSELYGSKLVAALDRQHPRDLFEVRGRVERGGVMPEAAECIARWLAGHHRPVHGALSPRDQDMPAALENEFIGMTWPAITLHQLIAVPRQMAAISIHGSPVNTQIVLSLSRCS